ncbi:MAG: LysE family translocator [Arenicellales bacterium]
MEISWLLFLAASVVLIATPGQDLILVMSRAVTQGARAGVVTALGVSSGLMVHTVLATLGLGVILRTSEWLFFAMKIAGAAYLVYLGIRSLLSTHGKLALHESETRSLRRLYLDGALSNISNPKIAVFYLAFLPQFIHVDAPDPTASLFMLGLSFAVLTFLIKGPLGIAAGRLSLWIRRRPAVLDWLFRTSGVVLIGLGVRLALERRA